ncbi:MAG: hypothetical protein ABIQ31_11520 [Ferruginibacter sp.]
MKEKFIFIAISVMFVTCVNAQKGSNAVSLNLEGTFPFYQKDRGVGFSVKGLKGIGSSAQLTLSAGISIFNNKNNVEHGEITTRLIPFLVGYRQNIQRFFIEPQIGLGELGGRIKFEGDYSRPSVAAVFGGLGAGYTLKNRMPVSAFKQLMGSRVVPQVPGTISIFITPVCLLGTIYFDDFFT